MSYKKDLENKGNKGILTRLTIQNNPELKKQVDEKNKEANIFSRKPRITRSPPRTQSNKFSSHTLTYHLIQKQRKIRKKFQFRRFQKQTLTY